METYLGQSEWKKRLPKVQTSRYTLSILIIFFLGLLFTLYVTWWGDNNYTACPVTGCEKMAVVSYWHSYCTAFQEKCTY